MNSRRKPGRQPSNGYQPGWMFGRILDVIGLFTSFRQSGMKQSSCISETVEAIRREGPGYRISDTCIRCILANYHGKDSLAGLIVRRKPQEQFEREVEAWPAEARELYGNKALIGSWEFTIGPTPQYRRVNAANR